MTPEIRACWDHIWIHKGCDGEGTERNLHRGSGVVTNAIPFPIGAAMLKRPVLYSAGGGSESLGIRSERRFNPYSSISLPLHSGSCNAILLAHVEEKRMAGRMLPMAIGQVCQIYPHLQPCHGFIFSQILRGWGGGVVFLQNAKFRIPGYMFLFHNQKIHL